MPITNPAKRFAQRGRKLDSRTHSSRTHSSRTWHSKTRPLGPQVTGAAAVLAAVAAFAVCATTLPRDFVLPAMSLLFFILAALVALVASGAERDAEETRLTHWDVAGLLTFIGICAASQVDPDQMVRLVEGANHEH